MDEAGKMLERIIASRLVRHLKEVGADLSACQYGFREGRSTVDAILRLRSLAGGHSAKGGVTLAVSLDIANAFNILSWGRVREALEYFGVPEYLRRMVGDYLRGRVLMHPGPDGQMQARTVNRGVPQGSVLGPLLWNLTYDRVLGLRRRRPRFPLMGLDEGGEGERGSMHKQRV